MNNVKIPLVHNQDINLFFFLFLFLGIEFDLPFQGIRQKNVNAAASPLETEVKKDTEIIGNEIEEYVI